MQNQLCMVGSWVLKELINDKSVIKIISIGRRKTGATSEKLREIVHSNFLNFSNLKEDLANIDVCIYCLGVYQNQVPKDKFYEITCDYQKALTDVLEQTSPDMTFVLFGASHANPIENSWTAYSNAKGRAENFLNATSFPEKYIFRPGYIHPTGSRKPVGLMYKILLPISAMVFKLFPSVGISDRDLAKAMVNIGLEGESDSKIFSNQEMKDYTLISKLG